MKYIILYFIFNGNLNTNDKWVYKFLNVLSKKNVPIRSMILEVHKFPNFYLKFSENKECPLSQRTGRIGASRMS